MPPPPAPTTDIPADWLVPLPRDRVKRARYAFAAVGVVGMAAYLAQLGGLMPIRLGPSAAFLFLYVLAAARLGVLDRFKTRALSRESAAATACLVVGDVAGAKARFVALLPRSRQLGAYHATYLGLVGVCFYLEGDTSTGLTLADRALASGYLNQQAATQLRDNLRSWRIAMLLTLGDRREAEAELTRGAAGPTTHIVVEAYAERWREVIDIARRALDDTETRPEHRPTLALLGAHAARALDEAESAAAFEGVLASTALSPLARATPVYQRFVA